MQVSRIVTPQRSEKVISSPRNSRGKRDPIEAKVTGSCAGVRLPHTLLLNLRWLSTAP